MHGAAHNVGAFRASALQQAHAVHGVQQLAVGGLKAVDLGQSAAHDHAHGIGHIIFFQRFGNGRLQHHTGVQYLHPVAQLRACGSDLFGLLFSHSLSSPQSYRSAGPAFCRQPAQADPNTCAPVRKHPDHPDTRPRAGQCAPCGPPGCRPKAGRTPARCARPPPGPP